MANCQRCADTSLSAGLLASFVRDDSCGKTWRSEVKGGTEKFRGSYIVVPSRRRNTAGSRVISHQPLPLLSSLIVPYHEDSQRPLGL